MDSVFHNIAVACSQAFPLDKAGRGNQVILVNGVRNTAPHLVIAHNATCEFFCWSASEEPSCLSVGAATDHLIVHMNLGIRFLNEREPPPSVNRWLCKRRLMGVNREQIIHGDILRAPFNEGSNSKDALLSISFLGEHIWDKVTSLSQRRNHSQ